MEQTLTTAAFISAALFIVWILLVDPAADDVHAGLDMTFLGALLMVPVIIAVLIGIALLFPVIIAILLIGLILYGIFMLLRWFMTREKTETSSDPPKEGRVIASLRRIEKGVKALGKSRPVAASRERVRDSTIKVKAALAKGSHTARDTYRDTAKKVRESPKSFKERVARVKEGTVKRAAQVREKMDRTIAAGKERSRKLRQQGGKNTTDTSKPQTRGRNADGSGDTTSRKNGADPRPTSEQRDAAAKKEGDTLDQRREKSSSGTARDSSTPTSSNSTDKREGDERQHSSHRHGETKRSDGSKAGDAQSVSGEKISRDSDRTHARDERGSRDSHAKSQDSGDRREDQSRARDVDQKGDSVRSTEADSRVSRAEDSSSQVDASRSASREKARSGSEDQSGATTRHSFKDQKHSKDLHDAEELDSSISRDIHSQSHASHSKKSPRNVADNNDDIIDQKPEQTARGIAQSNLSDSEKSSQSVKRTVNQDAEEQARSSQREDAQKFNVSQRRKSKEYMSENTNNSEAKDVDSRTKSRSSLRERFTRLGRSVRSSDAAGRNQSAKAKAQSGTSVEAKSAYHRFLEWAKNSVRKLDGSATKKHSSASKVSTIRSIRRVHVSADADVFSEDYLRTMRPIGWKTRSKMDETYKKEAK